MRNIILDKAADAGLNFAKYDRKEDEELDQDTLRDAIMTDHVTPDEIAEAFVISALESLGFENDLKQRREDKIQKVLEVISSTRTLMFVASPFRPPTLAMSSELRLFAEKVVDAMSGVNAAGAEG